MALPLGKLTIIIGAGLVGSVLAKEGRVSNVSDFFSGAFKIVFKQLKQDGSTSSSSKPKNDSLMQQVSSLRQELQLLASHRSVTIVTGGGSGSGKYGVVVIVVVVGYGYVWWKGWKLSEMMFATRRGLNDACSSVAKQLETVYSSISTTRRHLSSKIDSVDCKIDECADNTSATKEEVSELRGDVKLIGTDVQSVHHVVRSLETKISRIEGRQNEMNFGVGKLVHFGAASSSSGPALGLPPELHGIADDIGSPSLNLPPVAYTTRAPDETKSESSSTGVFGRTFSGISASLLTRSRSALQSFK
ncbi:hypothetical protein PHJA_002091500 [Phtheirospermum japonicum]|uniref:DUF1664 domain-containing protein n=1 Tax=Phtheirospermum japonicum TaxID=374723 RepID=A0A830CTH9_9LAMI|nr:hypothetical protein PHJA_002091500 [Phtheirospermum japonicum]